MRDGTQSQSKQLAQLENRRHDEPRNDAERGRLHSSDEAEWENEEAADCRCNTNGHLDANLYEGRGRAHLREQESTMTRSDLYTPSDESRRA